MLDRRSFAALSAAAAAALVAGCSLFVDGPKESRLGVCSWSLGVPIDEVAVQMRELGIKKVHLALTPFIAADARHGGSENAEAWKRVKERVASGEWIVTAGMVSFKGEDYSTLESIKRTGGIVPDENWEFNRMLVEKGAALTKELGAKYVVSRATSDVHEKFLLNNGADEVVYPERQLADQAAIRYDVILANEDIAAADLYGIRQAPTLVVVRGGKMEKFENVSNIRRFIEESAAVAV